MLGLLCTAKDVQGRSICLEDLLLTEVKTVMATLRYGKQANCRWLLKSIFFCTCIIENTT